MTPTPLTGFTTQFAALPTGAQLHYYDSHPDPRGLDDSMPVVLALQGRLGLPEVDMPNIIDWLRSGYRLVLPSLRGYGQSLPKPRTFPVDFYQRDARDVIAFVEALHLPRLHLLGFSDGGETALLAAGMRPDLFRSTAVWGAVGYFGPEMRPWVQRNYPPTWISEEDQRLHGIADPDALALEWVQACKFIIDSGGDLSLTLAQNMTLPLLLMLGDEDRLNPIAYGQRLVDRAPNARLEVFACGHAIHDEQWERFQAVVGAFLRAADQPPAHGSA